jgi:hypothetical protein
VDHGTFGAKKDEARNADADAGATGTGGAGA